jgi:hypothetical protein
MVMGDLVLTEDEIEPVMLKLQQNGIEQTSIHNHLLGESPRVIYMHVAGHGDPVVLARSLASALALTKTPFPPATPAAAQQALDLKTAQVEQALGYAGKATGGVLQFSVPRMEKISDGGMEILPAMGTATAINFQPTGEGMVLVVVRDDQVFFRGYGETAPNSHQFPTQDSLLRLCSLTKIFTTDIYERRSKNRPQNAVGAALCGGVKVVHRGILVS